MAACRDAKWEVFEALPGTPMWTAAARAQLAREDLPYATCLTDAEWRVVAPHMPPPARTGRRREWEMRHLLDGMLYVLRTGCAWAHLPHEFPPFGTVHRWFLRLCRSGAFDRLARTVTGLDRMCAGRSPLPTACVVDAQAARSATAGVATGAGRRGYDAARRVVGRKRHALVDTDGRLLGAVISPASLHDSHGGIALLQAAQATWPGLLRCFADRAYRGARVAAGAAPTAVTVVGAEPGRKGFAVQPRRWVAERSFAHAGRCRRMARDYEGSDDAAQGFYVLASAMTLVRRIARRL